MKPRVTAEDWSELVEELVRSRQSTRTFAEAHGVSDASLRWWKSKLVGQAKSRPSGSATGAASPAMTLARVVRAGEESPPGAEMPRAHGITVVVGGARVLVEPGFDARHLRAVVKALGDEA